MRVPEGTLCANCIHFFWNDFCAEKGCCCEEMREDYSFDHNDFIVDGVEYDCPLVTECTKYRPR